MKAWRYGRKTPLTKFVVVTMVLVKIPDFYKMGLHVLGKLPIVEEIGWIPAVQLVVGQY
jgi:hypothetical protein